MRPPKRRRGDRKEGWQVRSLDAFSKFMPFIMKDRNDASNLFSDSMELDAADAYIKEKRAQGYAGFGMLHIVIAAYIRTVSQRPWINRFISGQRVYARHNIEICMAVKKELSAEGEETTIKVKFSPSDTALDVYNKMNAEINRYRGEGGSESNSTLKVANALCSLPRFLLRWAIKFLYWADYHGWLPQSLLDASPFHGSMFITNLASLGIPPIYHHLYNFGNVPVFIAIGTRRREYELAADGSVREKRLMDYRVVTDERICDGYYYARAFKMFKMYMRKPTELDHPPANVVEDLD